MSCFYCGEPIKKRNKFCNSSCCAKYRNGKHNPKRHYYCQGCNDHLGYGWVGKKYCDKCRYDGSVNKNFVDWSIITLKEFKTRFPNIFQMNARLRELARQNYKKSDKPKNCTNCGYDKFYEVCHIKAIKDFSDESKITDVNDLSNLIALCPNCHWELDHNLIKVA